jgi:hypothetical protein
MARGLRFRVDKHHVHLEQLLLAAGVVLPRVLEALLLHEGLDLTRCRLPYAKSGHPCTYMRYKQYRGTMIQELGICVCVADIS